jgi:hypothetical protein
MKTTNALAIMIAAITTLLAPSGEPRASDSISASASADHDTLLKAINFALTGADPIVFQFSDEASCVVTTAHAGTRTVETSYLNAIDVSRTNKSSEGTPRGPRYPLHHPHWKTRAR